MNSKGTLIVVKDCNKALDFYRDMFGLELVQDNDGNMELTGHLYLQEAKYWERFTGKTVLPKNNSSELYFEEPELESFLQKLQQHYPETEFVNPLMRHSWGQQVVRFYDPDGNLIEVGTPVNASCPEDPPIPPKQAAPAVTIRPEERRDYADIVRLILRSFREGTEYSDGTDIIALVEEIRNSQYYIPELSFVAELDGRVVGHFLFSHFPLSPSRDGGHRTDGGSEIVMLAPVSVHADYFRQGIGSTMIRLGMEKVKKMGYKGITVEGNFRFYNKVGFRTSSEYGIFPTRGWPMNEPRCMMCQETSPGSLDGIHGYIVYDMYFNA